MPDQSELDKDVAALRSHVIDGIEDLKSNVENVGLDIQRSNKLLSQLLLVGAIILVLLAVHVIRHW